METIVLPRYGKLHIVSVPNKVFLVRCLTAINAATLPNLTQYKPLNE